MYIVPIFLNILFHYSVLNYKHILILDSWISSQPYMNYMYYSSINMNGEYNDIVRSRSIFYEYVRVYLQYRKYAKIPILGDICDGFPDWCWSGGLTGCGYKGTCPEACFHRGSWIRPLGTVSYIDGHCATKHAYCHDVGQLSTDSGLLLAQICVAPMKNFIRKHYLIYSLVPMVPTHYLTGT